MLKEFELVIRTQADKEKLEEMIAAGWRVLNKGIVTIKGEPDRVFYHLSKAIDRSTK